MFPCSAVPAIKNRPEAEKAPPGRDFRSKGPLCRYPALFLPPLHDQGEKNHNGKSWTFPKGHIEKDESEKQTALREIKEEAMVSDGEEILALLRERKGKMPYSDATSPEIIRDKFGVSKAAFKRALGRLLKEGKIEQRDGWTYLRAGVCEENAKES